MQECEELVDESTLPEKPDHQVWDEWLHSTILEYLTGDGEYGILDGEEG
jgi:hypothetical protein